MVLYIYMPITRLKANTPPQAKQLLIDAMSTGKCIYLYGSGGNGKSYLINDSWELISRQRYHAYHERNNNQMMLRKSIICVNTLHSIATEYTNYILIDMNHIKFK
jgi:predicted ATPase